MTDIIKDADIELLKGGTAKGLFARVAAVDFVTMLRLDHGTNMSTGVQDEQFLFSAHGNGGVIFADGFYEKTKDGEVSGNTHYFYLSAEELRKTLLDHEGSLR